MCVIVCFRLLCSRGVFRASGRLPLFHKRDTGMGDRLFRTRYSRPRIAMTSLFARVFTSVVGCCVFSGREYLDVVESVVPRAPVLVVDVFIA